MLDYINNQNFSEVMRSLYLNQGGADIFFVFREPNGQIERVPGHKVLLSSSEKMAKLFAEGQKELKINDTPISVFKDFLKFFYMAKFNIKNIGATINVAKKYGSEQMLCTLLILGYHEAIRSDNASLKETCAPVHKTCPNIRLLCFSPVIFLRWKTKSYRQF